MEINAAGTGLRLLNPTQGTELRVSENGGTTAADLGLRSFGPDTPLAELNAGRGVRRVDGDDIQLTDSAGVAANVDLSGAVTVQDVIDTINTAATAAGARVTASFATVGNGIRLTDGAGGLTPLMLAAQNYSNAAADLGLTQPAVAGVIQGTDVNPVAAQGIFANVQQLRQAMTAGDQAAMTRLTENLQADYDRVVRIHGTTGAAIQEIETRQDRLSEQNLATQKVLSELEDTDFNEAISRFQLLQTSLQASLQTTGKILDLSLMDFLS